MLFRNMTNPLVSFVIPTRDRPIQLIRAVQSALAQTYPQIEVIVVVDGPDDLVLALLDDISSPALHIVPVPEPVGGAEARNIGIRYASGQWIALLDDDDQAMPDRIEQQLRRAHASRYPLPVVSSRFIAVLDSGEQILPRRLYRRGDPARYLFLRRSFRYGDGLLHTSTLLLPRTLMLSCPFLGGLRRHQDWDLILRLVTLPGVGIEMLPQPLARVQMQEQRTSVSTSPDWEFSLDWARERRRLLGRRAYAAFLATECMPRAAKVGASRRKQRALLRECLRHAWFSPRVMVLATAFFIRARKTARKAKAFSAAETTASRSDQ